MKRHFIPLNKMSLKWCLFHLYLIVRGSKELPSFPWPHKDTQRAPADPDCFREAKEGKNCPKRELEFEQTTNWRITRLLHQNRTTHLTGKFTFEEESLSCFLLWFGYTVEMGACEMFTFQCTYIFAPSTIQQYESTASSTTDLRPFTFKVKQPTRPEADSDFHSERPSGGSLGLSGWFSSRVIHLAWQTAWLRGKGH